jgi:succinate dehydrogenase/fumarate reductase cytochrome b subunit
LAAYAIKIPDLGPASIAAVFGAFLVAAKLSLKSLVVLPLTYHSWKSVQLLLWDTSKGLDVLDVIGSDWVLAVAVANTVVDDCLDIDYQE